MSETDKSQFMGSVKGDLREIDKRGRNAIRAQKKDYLGAVKETVVNNQENLARVISALYKVVYERAGADHAVLLMQTVREHEQEFGPLDMQASEILMKALAQYELKHKKSGYYYREYKDQPDKLFLLCFGAEPVGKVELIPGPMTICFRCYSDDDYAFARINFNHEDKKVSISDEERAKALRSQGLAFPVVRHPDLNGIVIMERAGNNSVMVDSTRKKEIRLEKNVETTLNLQDLEHNIKRKLWWKVVGPIKYPFQISYEVKGGQIVSANMWDNEGNDFIFLFDKIHSKFRFNFPGSRQKNSDYVDISVNKDGISFYNHTRHVPEIEYELSEGRKLRINDEELSKNIRRHEEQHQFNKLFIPREHQQQIDIKYFQYLEEGLSSNDPEEVIDSKRKIIEVLAKHYRRMFIDPRARDEIIAYYKEGRDLKSVANYIKTNPLYDYKNMTKTAGKGPGEDTTYFDYILAKVFSDLGSGKVTQNINYTSDPARPKYESRIELARPFNEDATLFRDIYMVVNNVLTNGYDNSVDHWLDQIKILEKMGYKKQEVVSFLGLFPIRSWDAFVRKLWKIKEKKPLPTKAELRN